MADESKPDKWRLIRGTNLKPEDRHCLLTLFLFQGDNGAAFCKQETLADEIGVDPRSVRRSLQRLNAAGIVISQWQQVNGVPMRTYAIDFHKLKSVQRANGRTPASYPETEHGRTPASARVGHQRPKPQDTSVLQEDPLNIHRTSKSTRTQKTKFQKPTADDVRQYAAEKNKPNFDAEYFVDYYESIGWKIGGKSPMKDWRATVRGWISRGGTDQHGGKAGSSEAAEAWQTLLDSLKRHSRFSPELIMGDIGQRAWDAIKGLGLKRLDEANEFDRRELQKRFVKEFQRQGAAA